MQFPNVPKRPSVLQTSNTSKHLQFGELQRQRTTLAHQNRQKYQRIIEVQPNFSYALLKINQNKAVSLNFGRELLLKQIDKLMEEGSYLDRQLMMIDIKTEEHNQVRQTLVESQVNPFEVIRAIWTSHGQSHESSIDHLDELNHNIAAIRLNVRKIVDLEKSTNIEEEQNYLRNVLKLHKRMSECQKCQQIEHSKQQLRESNLVLSDKIAQLNAQIFSLQYELASKDDTIRRLNKKMIELQTESNSKVMYLEQKLLVQDRQVKQLKRFKQQLQRNMFEGEGYALYVKCQEQLDGVERKIGMELNELIEFLSSHKRQEGNQIQEGVEALTPLPIQDMSHEQLLLELTLPIGKNQTRRTAMTDRPKTDRKRPAFNQSTLNRLQQLDIGKKYMRTNQLTSKRYRPTPTTPLDSKHTNSTFHDSPKSTEQERA